MSAATHVFKLDAKEGKRLSDALHAANYEFRPLQHAQFQARGEGVVVSLYRSGKLVVQGRDADAWKMRYLDGKTPVPAKEKKAKDGPASDEGAGKASNGWPSAADSIGSDEAGKGDTFGPLVVAAVAVAEDQVEELRSTRISDSKTMDDARIRILAPWVREHCAYEVRCLMPAEYNQAWADAGRNVNTLMTRLHFECQSALIERTGFRTAVVDRFSPSCPVSKRLQAVAPDVQVTEAPRAEAHLAVAAASVIAREAFLKGMANLSDQWGMDIPRGSGAPVPPALRRFLQIHGAGPFGEVTKLHFKNVQDFLARNGS